MKTSQFGGTLFEQGALLVLDSLTLELAIQDPEAYARMAARHSNPQ